MSSDAFTASNRLMKTIMQLNTLFHALWAAILIKISLHLVANATTEKAQVKPMIIFDRFFARAF
tara:strand:+ start:253 stop:444 length:192 start_codon:yes stop_codon:yes gene_type:complete